MACCHNPTGANLGSDDWQALTDFVLEKNVTPFVDIAYQGFGDGLAEDAANLRMMAARVPEMLIAASCSKNFGLYRDRVGCAMAGCSSAEQQCCRQPQSGGAEPSELFLCARSRGRHVWRSSLVIPHCAPSGRAS